MTLDSNSLREKLSAFMDGELDENAHVDVIDAALTDAEALATWHTYHVVGDVLRTSELAPLSGELEFVRRVQTALENVPAVPVGLETTSLPLTSRVSVGRVAANEPLFRWKWVAGVTGAVVTGWISWQLAMPASDQLGLQAQNTASENTPAVRAPGAASQQMASQSNDEAGAVMLRDAELDALLSAHQQLGGHSALQTPSGFLRNATYERSLP